MSNNMAEENYRYCLFAGWQPILKYACNPGAIVSLEQQEENHYYSIIVYRTQGYVSVGCFYDKDEALQKYVETCKLPLQEINTLFKEKEA